MHVGDRGQKMNFVETLLRILLVKASAGGSVYVPPTLCLRPACSAAHAAAYVGRTGCARTNESAAIRPKTGPGQKSFIPGGR